MKIEKSHKISYGTKEKNPFQQQIKYFMDYRKSAGSKKKQKIHNQTRHHVIKIRQIEQQKKNIRQKLKVLNINMNINCSNNKLYFVLSKSFSLDFIDLLRLLMCVYADRNQWVWTTEYLSQWVGGTSKDRNMKCQSFYSIRKRNHERKREWKCECISGKYQPFGRWIFDLVIYVCAFKEHFVFLYLFYPHNFGIVFKIKKNQRKGSSFSLFFSVFTNQSGSQFFFSLQATYFFFHCIILSIFVWVGKHQSEHNFFFRWNKFDIKNWSGGGPVAK